MSDESQFGRDARTLDSRIDTGAVMKAVLMRAPRIILLTALVLGATYAVLMFTPRLYESTAQILVEPRTSGLPGEGASVGSSGDAGVVSSQIELIKSRDTLLRVIEDADLRAVPEFVSGGGGFSPSAIIGRLLGRSADVSTGDQFILANLLDRLTIAQQRDSRVITVSVRTQDPDLSARIANAVANAHVKRRAELYLSDTADVSGWLGDEIGELRVSVEKAERAVADFRVEHDLFTGTNNTSLLDQQLSTIAAQINAAQERKSQALSRATLIRGLIEQGQSIESVPDVQSSAVIQQLTQERARLQGERAQLSATLLPNHPNIRAIDAQIGALENQLREEGRKIAASLEAEAEIQTGLEASLREELQALKASASEATRDNVTLQGLIREADAQRDLLESYLRSYSQAASRTDANSALPDVRVISMAAPAAGPVFPQTTMILLAVGIVMVTGQVGIIIFAELVSGRAIISMQALSSRRMTEDADRIFEEDPVLVEDEEAEAGPGTVPGEVPPSFMRDTLEAGDEVDRLTEDLSPVEEPVFSPEILELNDADRPEEALEAEPGLEPEIEESPAADVDEVARFAEMSDPAPAFLPDHERLSSDLVLGRCRVVLLAGHGDEAACQVLVQRLIDDCLGHEISVALIDAGSSLSGDALGIADLSTGDASFGDVVHKSADDGFAEVPWGISVKFDRRSAKPATLVEALSDIYEVVLVLTGVADTNSTLPAFAGVADRLVLVSDDDDERLETIREDLSEAGFGLVEIVRSPVAVAA